LVLKSFDEDPQSGAIIARLRWSRPVRTAFSTPPVFSVQHKQPGRKLNFA